MVNDIMIKNLVSIGAKFANLKKEETDQFLWETIFEKNLYEVNKTMLEQYFSKEDFWNKSYTYISEKSNIKRYVDENMDKYIPIILECAQGSEKRFFCDDESAIIEILNNQIIDYNSKKRYIMKMSKPLSNLSDISDTELWDALLVYKSIEASEDTIVKYFSNNTNNVYNDDSRNNILINFMNSMDDLSQLNFDESIWNKYTDIKADFYKLILSSTRLTKSADNIVKSATGIKFDLQEMPSKVKSPYVRILIEQDTLLLTDKNVQEIIDSYFEHINILINRNINQVCEYLKNRSIQLDESNKLTTILSYENEDLTNDEKIRIIQAYPDRIKYNTRYGVDILIAILRDHYVTAELNRYFKLYEDESPANKDRIYEELKRAGDIIDFEPILKEDHPNLYNKLLNDKIL